MAITRLHQLANDNTPHTINSAAGTKGIVHCKIDSGNDVYLYGSLIDPDSTTFGDWVLIETFTASTLKEICLPNYLLIGGSASDVTTDVGGTSALYLSYGK